MPRALIVLLVSVTLSCCSLVGPTKPNADVAVPAYHSIFPAIEELSATRYVVGSGCVQFSYRGGAYSTNPNAAACANEGNQVPITAAVDADIRALSSAMEALAAPLEGFRVTLDEEGHVAGRSEFFSSGCMSYFFEPGWEGPLQDNDLAVSQGVDPEWYRTDFCPG